MKTYDLWACQEQRLDDLQEYDDRLSACLGALDLVVYSLQKYPLLPTGDVTRLWLAREIVDGLKNHLTDIRSDLTVEITYLKKELDKQL